MLKWIMGISALAMAAVAAAQQTSSPRTNSPQTNSPRTNSPRTSPPGKTLTGDTLSFSFDLADQRRSDTVYLHPATPTTLLRFYNKNLRGIYHSDNTPIAGKVIITFFVDSTGRFTGACNEDPTDPVLALEVLHVTRRLSQLPLVPTTISGIPFASKVRLTVVFRKGEDISAPRDPNADVTVDVYGVQY